MQWNYFSSLSQQRGLRKGGSCHSIIVAMKSKALLRKEHRKAVREGKKWKPVARRDIVHQKASADILKPSSVTKKSQLGPLQKILSKRKAPDTRRGEQSIASDPLVEAEDREIARLEKLLFGESKDGRSKASKLNREFELYEGLGSGVGDFLMELDQLADRVKGGASAMAQRHGANDEKDAMNEEQEEEYLHRGHVVGDSDQEKSDIDEDEASALGEEEEASLEDEENEDHVSLQEEVEDNDNYDDEYEDGDNGGDDGNEGDQSDHSGEASSSHDGNAKDMHTYRPTAGQDIYGRSVDGAEFAPIPNYAHVAIDETSDSYRSLRRQVNGLLNRLSDQSKDGIVRSLKALYESNSLTVTSHVLNACVTSACSNSSQIMATLTPLYAVVIAALHFTVGVEVGAFILEHVFLGFDRQLCDANTNRSEKDEHSFIGNKLPANLLMLIIYLYNFRVVHHTLIIEILERLAEGWSGVETNKMEELEAELILLIVDNCGVSLRTDDPVALKRIISLVNQRIKDIQDNKRYVLLFYSVHLNATFRISMLMEVLQDFRNNKSRRQQSANEDLVKHQRKWIGSVKSALGSRGGDVCLRVGINDLKNAKDRGRWWISGAAWQAGDRKASIEHKSAELKGAVGNGLEEQLLLNLASKMRMNTNVRRSIFLVKFL